MKDAMLAAERPIQPMPVGEAPSLMLGGFEFPQTPVPHVGEAPSLVLGDLDRARGPIQVGAVPVPWNAPLVQVQQNNYSFYFGKRKVRPTEELRVVQSELETAIRKLTYEDDGDEGFLPSRRSRQQAEGFASAHATAHALRRTNEALRALTNAVHVLHTIEKNKYAP